MDRNKEFTLTRFFVRITRMSNEILITGTIVISAVILTVSVLLQKKDGGLGGTFGGGGGGSYMKQRGAEKFIFYMTIISAIVFTGAILVSLVVK